MTNARAITFYLPQFHPIPENDEWWGKGFTEWTNTAKAKPLFRAHYQPHVPADLGFYDLRCPETRRAQADLARSYGIEGFCYYHYWFAGQRLLERPFNEVLASGEPDFPFCVCWANQTWSGIWHGAPNRILIEQTYPGDDDYIAHFYAMLPAFQDPRHIRVDGKPVFVVYRPTELPNTTHFADLWRALAIKEGLPGLFLIGINHFDQWKPGAAGFDAAILQKLPPKKGHISWRHPLLKLKKAMHRGQLTVYDYKDVMDLFLRREEADYREYPCAIPNWDNTPRSGFNGLVLENEHPDLFRRLIRRSISKVAKYPTEERLLFIKSWNEWAEGNHLEPDLKYGHAWLEVICDELAQRSSSD
ncbi:MAG: glycoside hydrolase family 99-like domain-containing protein [Burkholderiales bacterium]|nr:glycoside hydrolase family 99-like domain-containing protein [Burkholderiales bacterium]